MRHEWRLLRVRIPVVDGDNNYDFYCIHCLKVFMIDKEGVEDMMWDGIGNDYPNEDIHCKHIRPFFEEE
tara:strand:- start:43 stop:249 length:207 start_codon:yes stop_codon:yes gene_type:complete